MSKEEKSFIKEIDAIILKGNSEKYFSFREIDKKTQLSGLSFYDVILYSNCEFPPQLQSKENNKK